MQWSYAIAKRTLHARKSPEKPFYCIRPYTNFKKRCEKRTNTNTATIKSKTPTKRDLIAPDKTPRPRRVQPDHSKRGNLAATGTTGPRRAMRKTHKKPFYCICPHTNLIHGLFECEKRRGDHKLKQRAERRFLNAFDFNILNFFTLH